MKISKKIILLVGLYIMLSKLSAQQLSLNSSVSNLGQLNAIPLSNLQAISSAPAIDLRIEKGQGNFLENRRNRYSALWAFASLNYLYADLLGFMDKDVHAEYETGTVGEFEITPQFLTVAGGFMQIPLSNVFLPQVIKNDKVLRWVQIASGTIMTLVQTSTLFAGKPTPYYLLFSTVEIAATAYITIDSIKWKTKKNSTVAFR